MEIIINIVDHSKYYSKIIVKKYIQKVDILKYKNNNNQYRCNMKNFQQEILKGLNVNG